MFRWSLPVSRLVELIANGLVPDMTKREDLYHAASSFLTAVAKHPISVAILPWRRPTEKRSPGLEALGGDANRMTLSVDTSSASLISP
jgi:hypothetical protein